MAVAAVAAPFVAGAMGASAITIAGLALGAIGTVTGNKNLALVGSMIGLAGGFLGGGAIAGSESASAGSLESLGTNAADYSAAVEASQALPAAESGSSALNTTMNSAGIINGADPSAVAVTESGVNVGTAATPVGDTTSVVQPKTTIDNLVGGGQQPGAYSAPNALTKSGGGIVDRVMDWAKGNPMLSYGLVTTGGRMLQAGFGENPEADRVKARNYIELEELNRKTNNMAGVASVKPLNLINNTASPFRTDPYVAPTVGLVNKRLA